MLINVDTDLEASHCWEQLLWWMNQRQRTQSPHFAHVSRCCCCCWSLVSVVDHLFLLLVTCFCLPAGPWIELTTGRPSWVALTRYGKLVVVCVYRPTPRLDLYLDGRSAPFISCHISHVLERVTGLGPLYSLNSGDTVATGAAGRSHWGHTVYIEYLSTTDWKMLLKATMKIYHIFLHSTL